jgi:hypothetical protein
MERSRTRKMEKIIENDQGQKMKTFKIWYTYRHDLQDYYVRVPAENVEEARTVFKKYNNNGAYIVFRND